MRYTFRRLVSTLCAFYLLAGVFFSPAMAVAAPAQFTAACQGSAANSSYCEGLKTDESTSKNSFYGSDGILAKASNIIAVISGFAAIIAIIVSGIRFVMAEGDANKVREARNTIIYAVVGLIIIILARNIIAFVLSKFS